MRITLILFFLGACFTTFGQQISIGGHAVASGFSKDAQGRNVDWTLGVAFAQIVQGEHHLTEGFQQGSLQPALPDAINERSSEQDSIPNNFGMETTLESSNSFASSFKIFPNPCQDQLSLSFQHLNSSAIELTVINATGLLVLSFRADVSTTGKINLPQIHNLPSGPYLIQINDHEGHLQTLRFIKQ